MSASDEKLSSHEKPAEVVEYEKAAGEKTIGDYDEDAVKIDVHTGLYDGLQRNMKQRHIQMIALAGVRIPPLPLQSASLISSCRRSGLACSSGRGKPSLMLALLGRCRSPALLPRGSFKLARRLAYMHVGTICYCMLMSLGEMMCYMPISGGCPYTLSLSPSLYLTALHADIHFAERFLDPAMGFALGWLQWYGGVVSLPTEIISATLIIGFWDTGPDGSGMSNSHLAGYLTVSLLRRVLSSTR
jgi:amino acid transporter